MKKLRIVLAAVCLAALCFVMAGCGGGGGGQDASAEVIGTWELSGGQSSDGTKYGAEEISLMKTAGMNITFKFDADGTVVGTMAGEEAKGTWKAADASTIDITINDQTQQGVIKNGELSITINGETLMFSKTKA